MIDSWPCAVELSAIELGIHSSNVFGKIDCSLKYFEHFIIKLHCILKCVGIMERLHHNPLSLEDPGEIWFGSAKRPQ